MTTGRTTRFSVSTGTSISCPSRTRPSRPTIPWKGVQAGSRLHGRGEALPTVGARSAGSASLPVVTTPSVGRCPVTHTRAIARGRTMAPVVVSASSAAAAFAPRRAPTSGVFCNVDGDCCSVSCVPVAGTKACTYSPAGKVCHEQRRLLRAFELRWLLLSVTSTRHAPLASWPAPVTPS